MFRVICTSEGEKRLWLEASQYLSKIKDIDTKQPAVRFLTELFHEPGNVEVQESGVVVRPTRRATSPKKDRKRFGYNPRMGSTFSV